MRMISRLGPSAARVGAQVERRINAGHPLSVIRQKRDALLTLLSNSGRVATITE